MRVVTFDIETSNIFADIETNNPADLDLAIVCVHDSQTDSYTSYVQSELPQLWPLLTETDMLVGYNSDHFDIPLLNKYYPGDLTQIKSLDLMKELQQIIGRRVRLDAVAEATLKINKSGDGLQALRWWRDGLVEKVREYCIKDVEITRGVFDYALSNGALKYKELGKVKEVKLDTSRWMEKQDTALTHTLGF